MLLLTLLALLAPTSRAQTAPSLPANLTPRTLTDEQVVSAISGGIDYLLKDLNQKLLDYQSHPQRSKFDCITDNGEALLETYSLLYVGSNLKDRRLSIRDEPLKTFVEILQQYDSNQTYHTSLQALALSQLPATVEVKAALTRCASKLAKGRTKTGGYTYHLDGSDGNVCDGSNSQYALLAVWAAADSGVNISMFAPNYWKETSEFWKSAQGARGWGYRSSESPTKSMTAAGIASLYVCDEFLNRSTALEPRRSDAINDGLSALLANFDPDSADFYYLYGVERAGLASGSKFFGQYDWYRHIAVNILKRQNSKDGSFRSQFTGSNDPRSTAYAILILSRGRAPVVMNKLQYDGPWNARPRDAANLHSYLAREYERHLNWQSVPITSFPEDWLEAPVLLITGSKDPGFTPDDVDKLRQFINYGGVIFSVADGDSKDFTAAMTTYASQIRLSPNNNATFRELPPDHPIFTIRGNIPSVPKLYGLSNGIRELWIHCPQDLGAAWQSVNRSRTEAWDIPANLLFYVAGKEGLRSRLQTLAVAPPLTPPGRQVTVVRLQNNANWDPEPGAWPRLSRIMALRANTDLTLKSLPILDLPKLTPMPALAHLAGTEKFALTPEETQALRDYVNAGGTLFVEALGGKEPFATSAAAALKTAFPDSPLKIVPSTYTLYTGVFSPDALNISEVAFRRSWTLQHGFITVPRIQYMNINRRAAIFFSPEDLTSGLLGTNIWGIDGYTQESATALARNLVLFAWRNAPKTK